MSIRTKLTILFVALASIPLLFLGLLSLSNFERSLTQEALNRLEAVSLLQKERVIDFLNNNTERVAAMTSRVQLRIELDRYIKEKNTESLQEMQRILSAARQESTHEQTITLVGLDGTVIASTDAHTIGGMYWEKTVLDAGQTMDMVMVFSTDAAGGKRLHLAGPLVLESSLLGIVVIESGIDRLTDLFASYAGLGQTGEILLARRNEAGHALLLSPLRLDPNAALVRTVDSTDTAEPITRALARWEGTQRDTVDYRNIPVFSSTAYIEGADWGLVAKIDREEILAPVYTLRRSILALLGTVVGFCSILAYLIAKNFSDPIERLALAAQDIADGQFVDQSALHIGSRDEIGMLARSFETMADKLKIRYRELEAIVSQRTQDLQKFKLAVEGASDHIVITDASGTILYANPAVSRLTGFSSAEVIGKKAGARELWGGHMSQAFYNNLWRTVIGERRVFTGELKNRRKDGKEFFCRANIYPLVDDQNTVRFCVEIYHDITKEKEVDHMKDEFVSIASHELRTPLTAVHGIVSMMLDGEYGPVNDRLQSPLHDVNASSERLIRLVNDLLDLSRMQAGRMKYTLSSFPLSDLVSECVALLAPLTKQKNLSLVITGMEHVQVRGDRGKARGVLNNLIGNAIKFTDAGNITVSVKEEDNWAVVTVQDTGIGIPREEQYKLFGKFQQIEMSVGRPPGTGLGLHLSNEMARSMGGSLRLVSSDAGKGSVFSFYLPLERASS